MEVRHLTKVKILIIVDKASLVLPGKGIRE